MAAATFQELLSNTMFQYFLVFVFTAFGVVFVILNVDVLGKLLFRPVMPDPLKLTTYECGEPTIGSSWVQFDIRFYTVALIFIVFDVEVVFLFPWAAVFAKLGAPAFTKVMIFVGVLAVGFINAWKKGDLDWVTSIAAHDLAAQKDARLARARQRALETEERRAA
ncbi:MAG: NAD(P)H-quinone oxidoreductase subunit 3, chloroplastic [Planctomycetes bacterium]|nr:NAD(P)H-quinone oxidoreductase subunit 3, chloroplastic [Planctomycetota bacterium]GIK52722.1 MAG: NADH-quinone oxidoreductase subunit A [Planctomycetota bacterium]HRJ77211.1 NADH-quinone oxidoreductase subunit A [Planctomycetota bacterium]